MNQVCLCSKLKIFIIIFLNQTHFLSNLSMRATKCVRNFMTIPVMANTSQAADYFKYFFNTLLFRVFRDPKSA